MANKFQLHKQSAFQDAGQQNVNNVRYQTKPFITFHFLSVSCLFKIPFSAITFVGDFKDSFFELKVCSMFAEITLKPCKLQHAYNTLQ